MHTQKKDVTSAIQEAGCAKYCAQPRNAPGCWAETGALITSSWQLWTVMAG